jgi:hypothetical protein
MDGTTDGIRWSDGSRRCRFAGGPAPPALPALFVVSAFPCGPVPVLTAMSWVGPAMRPVQNGQPGFVLPHPLLSPGLSVALSLCAPLRVSSEPRRNGTMTTSSSCQHSPSSPLNSAVASSGLRRKKPARIASTNRVVPAGPYT